MPLSFTAWRSLKREGFNLVGGHLSPPSVNDLPKSNRGRSRRLSPVLGRLIRACAYRRPTGVSKSEWWSWLPGGTPCHLFRSADHICTSLEFLLPSPGAGERKMRFFAVPRFWKLLSISVDRASWQKFQARSWGLAGGQPLNPVVQVKPHVSLTAHLIG